MQRIVTMVLGLVVVAGVAFAASTGGEGDADLLEIGEAPKVAGALETGGNTPLAPPGLEPDLSDSVLFIEGEPVYDLDSIPVYDENGNLIPYPYTEP